MMDQMKSMMVQVVSFDVQTYKYWVFTICFPMLKAGPIETIVLAKPLMLKQSSLRQMQQMQQQMATGASPSSQMQTMQQQMYAMMQSQYYQVHNSRTTREWGRGNV